MLGPAETQLIWPISCFGLNFLNDSNFTAKHKNITYLILKEIVWQLGGGGGGALTEDLEPIHCIIFIIYFNQTMNSELGLL